MKDWHIEAFGYLAAVIILLSALIFTVYQMEKQDKMIMEYLINHAGSI